MSTADRRVVIVGYPDVELLDVACPGDAFASANRAGAAPPYSVELVTSRGATIRSSCGIALVAQRALEQVAGPVDTLIVAGGHGHIAASEDRRIVAQISRIARDSRRIVSICTGVSLLAAAGLVDGKRVATHWQHAAQIAARFPAVVVDPVPLYISDGRLHTSAGVTSALDLSLSLIADDHGPTLARKVAQTLVTYLHRRGDQAQISMFLAATPPGDRVVRDLLGYIAGNLAADLSAPALASRAGISVRHLRRLFVNQLDTTPGRYVRAARTEAVAQLLTSSDLPLDTIARRCGFGTTETLRQAFRDRYGANPTRQRLTANLPTISTTPR
ncbi:Transcriptional regulator GlxA family, contains an amidase domain and an AraC-type DNA-binding HTH domain [Saccharopolyspora kobensis]|uniref:Transcriptional regulator GlxA family, contains an amidase domain and an AraC-type DNA-binding HTH domain n=1 Tax=Saccharopolyspora kobensis TaxID=146035 RepID=A0A1H6AJA2_9PSEU|nr:DJ-1/PfpI family protein [Saccharopolyspora kobensis]SEG48788.1 Transcriptional regulator GlxA family, contains an amidase domain and an AraC-type DNA-binding HTH domain [Saccharopolyspora kobensis]SFE58397.1 Transcriptional regulator GlxA family, contains an amidase domain and an AraC-type DNA-binding HTH domain [Saccharopolyspora kobensis]